MNKILKIFNCIKPIKGYARSILYDLNRGEFHYIPNSMFDFMCSLDGALKKNILKKIKSEIIFDEYYNFLIEKEIIFECNIEDSSSFIEPDNSWYSPNILNAISVEINTETTIELFKSITRGLRECNCHHMTLIINIGTEKKIILEILNLLSSDYLILVELFIDYNIGFSSKECDELLKLFPFINQIILLNAPKFDVFLKLDKKPLIYQFKVDDNKIKSFIDIEYFSINYQLFYESLNHNVGLNKKVHLDSSGNICISYGFNKIIGNIKTCSLHEVIKNNLLMEYWNVTKDKILICKDCEYRHMCFDDSELLKIGEGIYKRKEECPYNPYIALWDYDEGYHNLAQSGIKWENNKYIIDKQKLIKIYNNIYS